MKKVLASTFHDFTSSITGKASKINKYRIVPVILAREMIQDYSVWELTDFLRKQLPPELEYVKVFKSYEALKDSIKGLKNLPISFGHQGMITDNHDWRIEGWVYKIKADDKRRLIRGMARISTLHLTDAQIFLLDEGLPIDVSIGGTAIFGDGCSFCVPSYRFEQEKIYLNHLAILWNDKGKCTVDSCGLNLDSSETKKIPETGIHICGVNIDIEQPIFDIQKDILNIEQNNNINNTLIGEKKMPTDLEIEMALLKKELLQVRASSVKDIEKISLERDVAMNDGKNKCEVNKKLLKDLADKDTIIKSYVDKEKEGFIKFFGDKELLTKEKVLGMEIEDLREQKEIVVKLLEKLEDKSIKNNGFDKPAFGDRGDPDKKNKKLTVSSISGRKKKKEESDK